jgi:hypothetical protein
MEKSSAVAELAARAADNQEEDRRNTNKRRLAILKQRNREIM